MDEGRAISASVEELLHLLAVRSDEHAFILFNAEGLIQWWNQAAERIFGMPLAEAAGQPLSALFTRDQVEQGMPELELVTASAGTSAEDDRWMARPDGSRFWASGAAMALRDESGRLLGFGKILRNRTDLREQIETLRNRVETLEASGRRKDVFLSTLSHELRNPLAPLSDAVHLIRMMGCASAEAEVPLRIIERQIEALRRLVDDLLDIARIGAGKISLRKQRLRIQDVLHRAIETVTPLIRQRRQELDVLLPRVTIYVEGDEDRLVQVFVNLLNNSAKFTPQRGRIWVKATLEGDEAVIHIQDNGAGITHDMLPRIFELFTQGESNGSPGGLGIGLSLVKDLVARHGGSVQVESDGPGKGSVFSVRLPVAAA